MSVYLPCVNGYGERGCQSPRGKDITSADSHGVAGNKGVVLVIGKKRDVRLARATIQDGNVVRQSGQ